MKNAHPRIAASICLVGLLSAGLSVAAAQAPNLPKPDKPTLVTPPSPSDASRPPLPAARPQDAVKAPDQLPPAPPMARESSIPRPRIRVQTEPPVPEAVAPGAGEPVLTPTGRTAVAVTSSLDSAKFAPTIRATTLATREPVIADVESRITATDSTLASLNSSLSEMNAESRKQYQAAASEVKDKAKALRKSVQAARKATEQDWDQARTQLAADYEAYASALAKVDAATGIAPAKR